MQLEEFLSTNERDVKTKTDAEKAKKKAESSIRELQAKLDDEKKARENYENLASRHEKKANNLQTDLEKLES